MALTSVFSGFNTMAVLSSTSGLREELQPLHSKLRTEDCHSGDVPARLRGAGDHSSGYWISDCRSHDGIAFVATLAAIVAGVPWVTRTSTEVLELRG